MMLHNYLGLPNWDIVSIFSSWIFYYVMIHGLYYGIGGIMRMALLHGFPALPTNKTSEQHVKEQLKLSEIAFPLYCVVPTIGDFAGRKSLNRMCETVAECGGLGQSFLNFLIYMFLVEGGVFFVHYWMLHKWPWGKENMKHSVHHQYKHSEEMTSWAGYAFEAVDGASQGMPFILVSFIIPIPELFHILAGLGVGIWTLYIHVGFPHLPWPLMGADYHYIHHRDNWYNFGLFTVLWDTIFNTVRHPLSDKAYQKRYLSGPKEKMGNKKQASSQTVRTTKQQ